MINLNPRVQQSHFRLSKPDTAWRVGLGDWRLKDVGGELVAQSGKAQTCVTSNVSLSLAEEYMAGTSAKELARKYAIDKSTVWCHLAKECVDTGVHFMTQDEHLINKVQELRGQGINLREIAAQTGIPHP